jgi:hypothetical protein
VLDADEPCCGSGPRADDCAAGTAGAGPTGTTGTSATEQRPTRTTGTTLPTGTTGTACASVGDFAGGVREGFRSTVGAADTGDGATGTAAGSAADTTSTAPA